MTVSPTWTVELLRWVLANWVALALGTRPATPERPAGAKRVKPFRPPFGFLAAERLADVERALRQLQAEDAELASVVGAVYLRPDLDGLSRTARLALWGLERGVSYGTAWRRLKRAEERLVELLNGG